jgi:hypothetical protein
MDTRCIDFKYNPGIYLGWALIPVANLFTEPTRYLMYLECRDIAAVQIVKCSANVIKSRQYVPGDIMFTNIYPEDPISLESKSLALICRKTVFDEVGFITTEKPCRITNRKLSLEIHKLHQENNGNSLNTLDFKPIKTARKPHLLIFSNTCNKYLNRLVDDEIDRFNVAVLGMQTEWLGFGRKLIVLYEFLKKLPLNDLVVISDASDVRFLPGCSVDLMIKLYSDFATPIVFMAEDVCWPDGDTSTLFPVPSKEPIKYRYLNAGLSVGKVWAYIDLLDAAFKNVKIANYGDDQRFWQNIYLSNRTFTIKKGRKISPKGSVSAFEMPYISLDVHQHLMVGVREQPISNFKFDIVKGKVDFKPSDGSPCMFHQPGPKVNGNPDVINAIFNKFNI